MRTDRCANFYASAERATRKSDMLKGNTGSRGARWGKRARFVSLRLSLTKLRTGYAKHQRSVLRMRHARTHTRTHAHEHGNVGRLYSRGENIRSGKERRGVN